MKREMVNLTLLWDYANNGWTLKNEQSYPDYQFLTLNHLEPWEFAINTEALVCIFSHAIHHTHKDRYLEQMFIQETGVQIGYNYYEE